MSITMSEETRNKIVGGIFLVVALGAVAAVWFDWGTDKKTNKLSGRAGEYQVKPVGKKYFVIYKFTDGEEMLMATKAYASRKAAEKRMASIKSQAGK